MNEFTRDKWDYLEAEAAPDAPISDNPSGLYCKDCRACGLLHCCKPEYCGGMRRMKTGVGTEPVEARFCTGCQLSYPATLYFCDKCDGLGKPLDSEHRAYIARREKSIREAIFSAHRACGSEEHNPLDGKIHGYCVVCLVPWPCTYAGRPPATIEVLKVVPVRKPHREICGLCHDVSPIGFHVPNDIWELVVHRSRLQDIHCLRCFTRLADEKGVQWDTGISFYPVSRVTFDADEVMQAETATETDNPTNPVDGSASDGARQAGAP